jgi:Sensors of blue-light using FAD
VNYTEPKLAFVAYASAASEPFSGQALGNLLLHARRNNSRLGLTGMLLCHEESFFQVLEGSPSAVDSLYERICADQRHTKVIKLIREPIEQRSFAEWTMGLGQPDRDELGAIPGLNDFFRQGSCLWELEPGRARTLLVTG